MLDLNVTPEELRTLKRRIELGERLTHSQWGKLMRAATPTDTEEYWYPYAPEFPGQRMPHTYEYGRMTRGSAWTAWSLTKGLIPRFPILITMPPERITPAPRPLPDVVPQVLTAEDEDILAEMELLDFAH